MNLPIYDQKLTGLRQVVVENFRDMIAAGCYKLLVPGDSMNDEAMIKWAGVGVAMANGDTQIKAIATVVTERSNDDDGIVDIIDRYVLR
ncbi:MAG: HAD hydrolase family protein [Treponema sp.]|jgi:hydroxymethylpyrimidine pyrophosphatase-like HAD family hydrolase|nr:HAD hydrolase family protein [Treponema sp.]